MQILPSTVKINMVIYMETIYQSVDANAFAPEELQTACEILQRGGLVAFPTETVYGLGGDALLPEAAVRIYEAKGRPSDNPLIVHIGSVEALEELAAQVPEKARKLAKAFWPGPLTLILPKGEKVPHSTTGGLNTVAIRMPEHKIALELIRQSGVYVAAPSANASGKPSPTEAWHVKQDLDGKIDMIIDGGKVDIGIESTIVDLTEEIPLILRPGAITKSMMEKVIGPVEYDPAVIRKEKGENIVAKAPGMKYRHYAPQGEMTIVEGSREKVVATINRLLAEKAGEKTGVIASEETKNRYLYKGAIVCNMGSRTDEAAVAARLYEVLRQMDELQVKWIFAESFASEELGQAIMNRMFKAAGYHIINADEEVYEA